MEISGIGMDIVPKDEVAKEDLRNSRRRFLQTDSICSICGAICNSIYEERCLICDCGSTSFISGDIGVNLRLLLNFHYEDLRALCEIHGVIYGNRAGMVVRILKELSNERLVEFDIRINEELIRRIIKRNHKKFWFIKDIEDAVYRVRKKCNIHLVDEREMK